MPRPNAMLLALAAVLAAPPLLAADLQSEVDAAIEPLMREHGIAGMAVAVYDNGQAHYFNYGWASKRDKVAVTRDTLFEVGSVSKTFTATLVAMASVEGKLDLDAPASQYQPALAGSAIGSATVRELGAYSGDCLPLQFPDTVQTPEQTLAFFQHWQRRSERGSQRCYSNPSLGLFGDLAGRAQQHPFAQVMTENVLPRLGLQHTWLEVPQTTARCMPRAMTPITSPCAWGQALTPSKPTASRPAPATCCTSCSCNCSPPRAMPLCARQLPSPKAVTSK